MFTATRCFLSLEETYEALRYFGVLGIDKKILRSDGCSLFADMLKSELAFLEGVASRVKATLRDAISLLDFHFSFGGLVLVKEQRPEVDVILHNAQGTFQSNKALSQSDGR